jgi:glutathione S-transferase
MSLERTLLHFPLDPASRQVRLALGEKRLPFIEQAVRYWERPPELVALNPSGLTPVLKEGEVLVLCESRAIVDHLEETYPDPPLLPHDPAERAEARRLIQWFDRKFDFEVGGFLLHEKMEKRLLGPGARRCGGTWSMWKACCRPATGWPGAASPWRISPRPPICR